MGKYAHFERLEPSSLHELYQRHGEVARDIHQSTLRKFTDNPNLEVELIDKATPFADKNLLDKMSEYDCISASVTITKSAATSGEGLSDAENIKLYRKYFEENDMPVYVVSAGNDGDDPRKGQQRLADFPRNSLVVGEATVNKDKAYLEDHSGRINPTLASDSPFNRGEKYQFIDKNPSLDGREDLIRNYLVDEERDARLNESIKGSENGQLDWETHVKISNSVYDEGYGQSQEVNDKIKGFMDNPESLHSIILSELREDGLDFDDRGFLTGIDGTSFSGPEQAGYISGALYEQEQREGLGLPILVKDEIESIAKMATIDNQDLENSTSLMKQYNNRAGIAYTTEGGLGIFMPEMYRDLLDEAYHRIETNPDIDREIVSTKFDADVEGKRGSDDIFVKIERPGDKGMLVDRVRFDVDYKIDGNGILPNYIVAYEGQEVSKTLPLQTADGGRLERSSWARTDEYMGEVFENGKDFEILVPYGNGLEMRSVSATVHGYNEGGFMQGMVEYSQQIADKYQPEPEEMIQAAAKAEAKEPEENSETLTISNATSPAI